MIGHDSGQRRAQLSTTVEFRLTDTRLIWTTRCYRWFCRSLRLTLQSSHLRTVVRIWRTKISKDAHFFMPVRPRDAIIWVHSYSSWHFHFNKKWHQFNGFKIKPSWHKALLVPFTWRPLIQVGNTKYLALNGHVHKRYANDSGLSCGHRSVPHVILNDLYMT